MANEKNDRAERRLMDQILEQLPTPVMAVSTDLKILFMNKAGRTLLGKGWEEIRGRACADMLGSAHCGTPECHLLKAITDGQPHSDRNELTIASRSVPVEVFAAPLKDDAGTIIGGLEYIIDITDRVHNEKQLREQARTIREISTPTIRLWDGVVVLPVVGAIDSIRAQQMMDSMLTKISETACKVMILDIQGVPAVDTAVANHLIKVVKATRLMGCHAIISGISAAVAQTIVNLGIDMGVKTTATLRDALAEAFDLLNYDVRQVKTVRKGDS